MTADWSGYKIPKTEPKMVITREPGVLGRELTWCEKPDCDRLVYTSVLYCCTACSIADEHQHEIDKHDPSCEQRWEERKALVPPGGRYGQP